MATWTLFLLNTPLGTTGTGLITELAYSSSRSMSFPIDGPSTLSFDMPAAASQTALIKVFQTDVLLYRDEVPIQRYRITAESVSKSEGDFKCSYSCLSYRYLLSKWFFTFDDTRNWPSSTTQSTIAWAAIDQQQIKYAGNLGITQGTPPASDYSRTMDPAGSFEAVAVGTSVSDFIDSISNLVDTAASNSGFDWDIEPDPNAPMTALKFNTWAGKRISHPLTTPTDPRFVLDDGGSMQSWTRSADPTEYANYIVAMGEEAPGSAQILGHGWRALNPTTGSPDAVGGSPPPEGRMGKFINDSSAWTTQLLTNQAAASELRTSMQYAPSWSTVLAPGRYPGRSELWLGDVCRILVNAGPFNVDVLTSISEIGVSVSDAGQETVTLSLGKTFTNLSSTVDDLYKRLDKLGRR